MPVVSAQQKVNDYILEEKIGHGAFSEVWRARHEHLGGPFVAIKVPSETAYARNLQKDAVVHGLRHPAIVTVSGFNPYADPPYLIMEYVPGKSLRALIKAGKLPAADAIAILRQILAGLAQAHAAGIIHRDVKPENVLIHEQAATKGYAGDGMVKVADFGLGKVTADLQPGSIQYSGSVDGHVVGTLDYMSPEQRRGAEIDPRADLYACGIMLFEMLTGRLPEGHQVPSDIVPNVPKYLDDVFVKAYAPLEKRFKNCAEFAAALQIPSISETPDQVIHRGVINDAGVAPAPFAAKSRNRSLWLTWIAGVAAATVLVFVGIVSVRSYMRYAEHRDFEHPQTDGVWENYHVMSSNGTGRITGRTTVIGKEPDGHLLLAADSGQLGMDDLFEDKSSLQPLRVLKYGFVIKFGTGKERSVSRFGLVERFGKDPSPRFVIESDASGLVEGVDYVVKPDVLKVSTWYDANCEGAGRCVAYRQGLSFGNSWSNQVTTVAP